MKELRDKFPSGKDFLALSNHQITETVLEIIVARAENTDRTSTEFLSVGELENIYDSVSLPAASQQQINYKLMEAYQWLLSEGYTMPAPGQPAGVVTVTPKGRLGLPPESNVENKPLIERAGGARVTLAIVFTDIVGSTALGVQLGDAAMNEVRRAHFAHSRTLIARHLGREIKTIGDSVMAVFRSAGAALDYAYALHLNPGPSELQVRAGIHIGSVDVVDNDVFGTEVALANRVVTAIAGAEIWLSDRAKEDVDRAGAHRGLQWQPHDGVELKGIGIGRLWSLVLNSASTEPEPGKILLPAAHRESAEPQSALKISTGESGGYIQAPARGVRRVERTLNLRLDNISPTASVTGIKIVILAIEPQTEYVGPWTLAEDLSLAAGDHKFVPLVSYNEAANSMGYSTSRYDRSDSFFQVLSGGICAKLPKNSRQLITLRATGFETAPYDYRCHVWVDQPDGRLRIAEVATRDHSALTLD